MNSERAPLRLYVEAPLEPGGGFALAPAQAHYATNVMRRGVGDALLLFNGRDGEWRAWIAATRRGRSVAVEVEARVRPQADGPDLWLVFAPVKRVPVDLIARTATELGVAAFRPVLTRRTAVARVNLARFHANAIEAAEQCGRLDVPACLEPAPLDRLLADWPAERHPLFCDESGGGAPLAAALADAEPGPWAVIVGPEGGFAAEETAALAALPGALRVGLGPRTLRADTAAISALACWQALVGDWRGGATRK
ncbi:MAG: 16S rRNA (uracil(1498)-N(3))-methyltransferase [Alphaproteobacteria bacterium]